MVEYSGPTPAMLAAAPDKGTSAKRRRRDPNEPVRCPFVVAVDSREQAPYTFTGIEAEGKDKGRGLIVPTTTVGLETGDYSIVGFEDKVGVERKSVPDWFGSIGGGRDRFEREIERLSEMEFGAVVIEGTWQEILIDRPSSTQVSGKVASRTIASWSVRYGVHFYTTLGRRHAELWTFTLLSMFWRQLERRREGIVDAASEAIAAPAGNNVTR